MTDENTEQETTPPVEESEQTTTTSNDLVAQANVAAKRMEDANAKMEANIKRQEALQVQNTLGGSADVSPPEKKEETPKEYADKVMSGDLDEQK